MERRRAKQQRRQPQALQERSSGKAVIFSCVTRHPHGSRADGMLTPMPAEDRASGATGRFAWVNKALALLTLWFRGTMPRSTFWLTSLGRLEYVSCRLGCNRLLRYDCVRSDVTGYLRPANDRG